MTIHESPNPAQGPFRPGKSILLASASPRRQALLTGLGISFHVQASPYSEPDPEPGEPAGEYVQRAAEFKARALASQKIPRVVVAADTVVVAGEDILGKPASVSQALDMLSRLNACSHFVLTGCCLVDTTRKRDCVRAFSVCTQVTFSRHSSDILTAYARTGEPMGKAGGYAIQGVGAFLVSRIQGSYSNVVGLPLNETVQALMDLKAITLCPDNE